MRALVRMIPALLVVAAPAAAQNGAMPLVSGTPVDGSTIATSIYYTQLQVGTSGFLVSESDKKKLGRALLETLGLRKETRSILVVMSVSAEGIVYPDVPLLSYQFDGSKNLLGVSRVLSRTLPLQRLSAGGSYQVTLKYKYSTQVSIDVEKATTDLANLIPGSTVATLATKPLVEGVGKVASAMLSLANSHDTSYTFNDQLSPYSGAHNGLVIRVGKPDQSEFGKIEISILGTPTLSRPPKAISKLALASLKREDGEDPSTLSLSLGGSRRYIVTEVKGLDSFSAMVRDRNAAGVKAFCTTAKSRLDSEFSLTPMDRVLTVHQAMTDGDFAQTPDNSWFFQCFDTNDRGFLKMALGLDPKLVVPPPVGNPVNLSNDLKYAFGCFATGRTGTDCLSKAPTARKTVTEAFAASVRIEQMDLAGVVDVGLLGSDAQMDREALLDALASKAGRFGCFPKGLILTSKDETKAYSVETQENEARVVSIRIRSVPLATIDCT